MTSAQAGRTPARPARTSAGKPTRTSRTPFVLLMVLLLGGGLLALLLLNTALNQGSFEQSRLNRQNSKLSDEEQALRQQLDAVSAPGELARKAQELGMVPGTNPVFIDPVTGQVHGTAKPASPKPTVSQPGPSAVVPAPALGPGAAPNPTTAPVTPVPAPPATPGQAPR